MAASHRPLLLVHGAWHGAWSWAALQQALDARGVPSYAIDLPGRGVSTTPPSGLGGDARAVEAALDALDRDVVLLGHSYGGAVVSEVASRSPRVVHAVYLCAFALTSGESVNGFLRAAPHHPVQLAELMRPQGDGSVLLDPERAAEVYGALPVLQAAAHVARLARQPPDTLTDAASGDPFGRVPTTYVLCERDQAVHPAHQEMFAGRCDLVIRLDSDHFPMLHSPAELADLLEPIARGDTG